MPARALAGATPRDDDGATRRDVNSTVHLRQLTELDSGMAGIDEQLDAAAKAELDEHGMTVIRDLLTPAQTSEALAAVQKLFDDGHAEDQHKDIQYTMNLTARGEIFRDIVTLPRLVSLECHLLGDDYILSGGYDLSGTAP